jgi:hypothetical protein
VNRGCAHIDCSTVFTALFRAPPRFETNSHPPAGGWTQPQNGRDRAVNGQEVFHRGLRAVGGTQVCSAIGTELRDRFELDAKQKKLQTVYVNGPLIPFSTC